MPNGLSKIFLHLRGMCTYDICRNIFFETPRAQAEIVPRVMRSEFVRSIAAIALATGASKSLLVAKDLLLVYLFGLGGEIDDFVAAYAIPLFFAGLLTNSVIGALVPAFVRERDTRGPKAAQVLMANTSVLSLFAAVVGASTLLVLRPALLAVFVPTLTTQGQARTVIQYQGLLVAFAAMVVSAPSLAVLQAQKRFVSVSLISVVTSCTIIAAVIVGVENPLGPIAAGVIAGSLIEAAIAARLLAREGYSPMPRWHGVDAPTRAAIKQAAPLLGGFVLAAGSPLVDQAFAARIDSAGLSSLQYGGKFATLALALPVGILGLTLLPKLSTLVAGGRMKEATALLLKITRLSFVIGVPVVVVGILASPWVVHTVYLHGAVTACDIEIVTRIQQCYLLQLPFLICTTAYGRMILAMSKSHILLFVALCWLFLNLALDAVFSRWIGLAGIALSTSVCYLVAFVAYLVIGRSLLREMSPSDS